MAKEDVIQIIRHKPILGDKLFSRGYLLTNTNIDAKDYPFFGTWNEMQVGKLTLLVHPKQRYFCRSDNEIDTLLIGHAYNPFTMVSDENSILKKLSENYSEKALIEPDSEFWNNINQLTGVFTIALLSEDETIIIGDASGMQTTFYGIVNGHTYVSSHTNLIGDLCSLQWDPYIKRLTDYRFFPLLGNTLPGDLTQFREIKRVIPNHYVRIKNNEVSVKRFYWPAKQHKSHKEIVEEVSELLHNNMQLITQKWQRPAISLTGGCDSKTTLACANGLYNKFAFFSYISSDSEKVDAEAAAKICNDLCIQHRIYTIPDVDQPGAAEVKEILNWNTGNIRYSHPNDVRKRLFFADIDDFDVEVKSWASEIGRSYYSKRFNGRTDFGDMPTPRKCTTLYKFFLHDRKLVKDTDAVFKEYLDKYFERADKNPVEWQEQFFWEFRVPSWNGLVITGEHRYSFDITIPYNNRRILELLLSAPINDRINDSIYCDIRAKMNPAIDQTGIAVTNLKHTKKREKAENLYYVLHTYAPF